MYKLASNVRNWPQIDCLKCTVPQMYRLASNVQIGLKCTDWPQMYRVGLKCTVPQLYCASNVQIGLKSTDWP